MTWALEVSGLSKTYKNGLQALKEINFRVAVGDFFALLGPNGAGKSTLIGVISSLVRKSGGTVKVMGIDIDKNFPKAKSLLGVVPQEFNINQFQNSLNVVVDHAGFYGIPRSLALRRAEKALQEVGLWERRKARINTLSGGMKRRLMIARALAHNPLLLILDEPTAGVDVEIRIMIWNLLKSLNKDGITIILTTHNLEEAEKLCRNIAIIDEGELLENTTMFDLLRKLESESLVLHTAEKMSSAPKLSSASAWLRSERELEIKVHNGTPLNHVFAELSAQSIKVLSVYNETNRLERVFLNMVAK